MRSMLLSSPHVVAAGCVCVCGGGGLEVGECSGPNAVLASPQRVFVWVHALQCWIRLATWSELGIQCVVVGSVLGTHTVGVACALHQRRVQDTATFCMPSSPHTPYPCMPLQLWTLEVWGQQGVGVMVAWLAGGGAVQPMMQTMQRFSVVAAWVSVASQNT